MKIFVTGATGFIGSHFVVSALNNGHTIVAQRRSESGSIKPEALKLLGVPAHEKEIIWLTKSIEEVAANDFQGAEVLVHLAAHTPNIPYDSLENCIRWNVVAPITLIRAASSSGISRIVIAGSCFEYGKAGERHEFIPVDAVLEPTQTYPTSKAMATIALSQLAIELKLSLSVHRIFQVFGEGEAEGRFWPSLKKAALDGQDFEMTTAEQVRDFIVVGEVAEKLLTAVLQNIVPGQPRIENLGTGQPQSLREFAEYWWKKWGASGQLKFGIIPQRQGEVMRYVGECN